VSNGKVPPLVMRISDAKASINAGCSDVSVME